MRNVTRLAAVAALVLAVGCRTPTGPSAEERAAYGDVAVVVRGESLERDYDVPATGWARGMGVGVGRGLGTTLALTFEGLAEGSSGGPLGAAIGAVVGFAIGVIYTPFSIIAGAATAPSTESIDAALPQFEAAVLDPAIPDRFRAFFVSAAREHHGVTVVANDRATTLVHLRVDEIEFGSPTSTFSVDSEFGLRVHGRVDVARVGDGATIWESSATVDDPSGTRLTFAEWAEHDAALARLRIDGTLRALAEHFAVVVFTGGPSPRE